MEMLEYMLDEFNVEASVTRRVLERIPEDKLGWRPHSRSMSLGQLAIHIASVPGNICAITRQDSFDVSQGGPGLPQPKDLSEINAALDQSIVNVRKTLEDATEETTHGSWRLVHGSQTIMSQERYKVWRSIMLNHWYHHRGQLSVYFRLLDVTVPSIYGPSADEQNF